MAASPPPHFTRDRIPERAGIGLRHSHVDDFLNGSPATGWLEIHTENYLGAGGPRLRALEDVRARYPLSCHGVGLSLGSAEGLDPEAVARRKALIDRLEPGLVSEHVAWSTQGGAYLNDLLPLPYTEETLAVICRNIDHFQEALGRRILVENPSTYVAFDQSTIPEADFMAEIALRTGCGLLLDVNNVEVTGHNHGLDTAKWIDTVLDRVPDGTVGEIHVAGHFIAELPEETVLIDDHGSPVTDAVWRLLERALSRLGPTPILVEWDTRIPELPVLMAEAEKAERIMQRVASQAAPGGVSGAGALRHAG